MKTNRHQTGLALLLVLGTIVVTTILGLAFVSSQSTNLGIVQNVNRHARARAIAEAGMQMAVTEVEFNTNWRSDFAHGAWVTDEAYNGGTFTITGEDGEDTDGDGTISQPTEGDGDLSNDSTDTLTLTVVGKFEGVTHTVVNVLTVQTPPAGNLLLVVGDSSSLTAGETSRKTLFESWGFVVSVIDDGDSQATFDTALDANDVVYVCETVISSNVGTKLNAATIGVVNEETGLTDDLELSSSSSSSSSATAIDIVDNSHYITSPFSTGSLTIFNSSTLVSYNSGTLAPGGSTLADQSGASTTPTLWAVDAGGQLDNGSAAAGRRVALPWGGTGVDFGSLSDDGKTLLERALTWGAAEVTFSTVQSLTSWTTGTTHTAAAGTNRILIFFADCETTASVTGVTYGGQTMTQSDSGYAYSNSTGGRLHMFYLLETGIAAASGSTFSVTWSGTASNPKYSARMYQYVDQSSPFRANDSANNIGPTTIATASLTVVDGDMVVAGVHCGNDSSYSWNNSFNEGTDVGSNSFTHSSADWSVTGSPGSVAASATVASANRQVIVAGVLQSMPVDSNPDEPSRIALYAFAEVTTPPNLVAHWALDEVQPTLGVGLSVSDVAEFHNSTVVDSFDSTIGPYNASTNAGSSADVSTNSWSDNKIKIDGTFKGDAWARDAGGLSDIIDVNGTLTGTRRWLEEDVPIPTITVPNVGASIGDQTYSTTATTTITSDLHVNKLNIIGNHILEIDGDITIVADNKIFVEDNAQIQLTPGSTLTIYSADELEVNDYAEVNTNLADPRAVVLYHHGSNHVDLHNDVHVYATIQAPNTEFHVSQQSQFYGTAVAQKMKFQDTTKAHIDQAGFAGSDTATDSSSNGNDGSYINSPIRERPGAIGATNTSVVFDGHDDYIEIAHDSTMKLEHGNISLWFRANSVSGTQNIFSKDSSGYDDGGHLSIYLNGSTLTVRLQSTTTSYYVTSASISAGTWYHVAFNWGYRGMQLYVNGTLVATDPYTGGLGDSSGGTGNSEPIAIGAGTQTSGDGVVTPLQDYFKGRIDDVRMYDHPLDSTQLANVFAGSAPGAPAEGDIVQDTAGYLTAYDLLIPDLADTAWLGGGGLDVTSATTIQGGSIASNLYNALTATGTMTFEIKFKPANITQTGPARIASMGSAASVGNFVFGQDGQKYTFRLRTSATGTGGTPDIESGNVLDTSTEQHVIVTYDGTDVRMYRNGSLEVTTARTGDFSTWASTYDFLLANEDSDDRPWLGEILYVAVWDGSMNTVQINNLFAGNDPGDGIAAGFNIRWVEEP